MMLNRISLVAVLFAAVGVIKMHAAARVWQNTGTDMNTASSWDAALSVAGGDVAKFTADPVTQPNLSASLSIAGVLFNTTTGGFTLTGTGDAVLTLTGNNTGGANGSANSSAAAIRSEHTAGINTVAVPIVLAPNPGPGSSFNQSGVGGTLLVSGNISGASILQIRGVSGSVIELSGNNTYSLGTNVATTGMTLIAGHNNTLGSGNLTISNPATLVANGTRSIANDIYISSGTTIGDGGSLTLSGSVGPTGSTNRSITNNNTAGLTLSGNLILGDSTASSRAFAINGTGPVSISGNFVNNRESSSFINALTYNGTSTLTLSGNGSGDGATLNFNGTSTAQLVLASDTFLGGSTLIINSTGTVVASGTRVIPNDINLRTTTGGTIIGEGGSLTLSGNVTGVNANRTLTVNSPAGTTLSGNLFLSDTDVVRTFVINGTGPVAISGNVINNSAANTLSSSLTYGGSNTLTLSGINAHTGGTSVNGGGTILLSGSGTLGDAVASVTVSGGSTLDLGGLIRTRTGNVILNNGTLTNGTLVKNGGDFDLRSGTISAVLDGTAGAAKTTAGTVTLENAHTFSGDMLVSDGMLLVNGSVGNGTVTVAGGALGGSGTIGGAVTLTGGALAPGNSAGTLTVNGAVTASAASNLAFEIGTTLGSYDVLKTGSLDATNLTLNLTNPSSVELTSAASFNLFQDTAAAPLVVTGTFDAVNLPAPGSGYAWDQSALYTSGTLSLVASGGISFASWQASKFTAPELADPLISGPDAIFGADGLTNLVKYALGLEPAQNVVAGLPVLSQDATNWIYTYTRPSDITDVTYTVEVATSLAGSWSTAGVTHSQVSDIAGVQTWQALYPRASAPAKINLRLRVTQ